jgi:hypothetical protein
MATVRVRIAILTVWITLSVCPFNRMAHTANTDYQHGHPPSSIKPETLVLARLLSNLVALENAFAKFISPLITCHLLRLWQCFGSELQRFFSEGT